MPFSACIVSKLAIAEYNLLFCDFALNCVVLCVKKLTIPVFLKKTVELKHQSALCLILCLSVLPFSEYLSQNLLLCLLVIVYTTVKWGEKGTFSFIFPQDSGLDLQM